LIALRNDTDASRCGCRYNDSCNRDPHVFWREYDKLGVWDSALI